MGIRNHLRALKAASTAPRIRAPSTANGAIPARVDTVVAPDETNVAVTCTTSFAGTSTELDQSSYPASSG